MGFNNTKTNDYVATPGVVGADAPTASMSYSGNTCGSNLQTNANLSATFNQPGDQVVYTFTIKNESTLNAKLDSINENLTAENSAIEYELSGASAGDVLGPNDEATLVVTVRYKNSVTSQPEITTWGLELKLNFSQTNDSPVPVTPSCSIDPTFIPQYYEYHTGSNVTVGQAADTTNWVQDSTELTGRNYFVGHDVEGGNVTANYACFVINDTQYCMKASSDGSTYSNNKGLLGTLKDAKTITCSTFSASSTYCSGGGLGILFANSNGYAYAGSSNDVGCGAYNTGYSKCNE